MSSIRRINATQYAYLKIITESSQQPKYIITEGVFGTIVSWGKKAASAVGNVVKKVGKAVGGWAVGLFNLIKYGAKMLINFVDGTYKKDAEKLNNDHTELKKSFLTVMPFMSCLVTVTEKVGNKVHDTEFKKFKSTMSGKNDGDVDKGAKDLGNSLWSNLKPNLTSALSDSKDKAKEFSEEKKLDEKADKIEEKLESDSSKKSEDKKDKSSQQKKSDDSADKKQKSSNDNDSDDQQEDEVQTEEKLIDPISVDTFSQYEKDILLEFNMKYTHELHDFIIDSVYKGLTPKTIIEAIDNIEDKTSQKPIIIENKRLEFKTLYGNLICEETNLQSNDKIIYESETPFIGKHLIFEQSEQKLKRFNKIITQQQQQINNQIITEAVDMFKIITWVSIAGTVIGLVFSLKALITGVLHMIPLVGSVIHGAANGATAPCDAATGTTAGQAVAIGKTAIGSVTSVKTAVNSTKTLVDQVKNAKDGGAGAMAQALANQPSIDISGGPSGQDLAADLDFNDL